MRAPDRKLRFALAVFEAAVSLGPVVAALLHEGVPLPRIGLIARAAYADGLADDTTPAEPLRILASDLRPLSEIADDDPILASPCLLDPWRSGSHLPALWGERTSPETTPRLAPDLERHVRSGSVIVAVESLTPREQWQCMRILLQQSSSSVLALECSMPPSTSDG